MSEKSFFDIIHTIFPFLFKLKKKTRKCRYCGYEQTGKTSISFCHECSDEFTSASPRKRQKYIKAFQIKPTLCPICRKNQSLGELNHQGLSCPKCGKFTPR